MTALFASDGNYVHPEFAPSVKAYQPNALETAKTVLTELGALILPGNRANATNFIQGHLSFFDQVHTYFDKTLHSLQKGKIQSLEQLVNAYKAINDPKIQTFYLNEILKSNGANSEAARERLEFVDKKIRQYLLSIMDQEKITAFAFVTPSLSTQAFSFAKFPVITVPFGNTSKDNAAFGLAFAGAPCTDDQLLSYAYTFEQNMKARKVPELKGY
ncbi:hypothetical protein K7432_017381 [Basidiobolus ranarum]|uniref:Amidase n=1 Tax=Basidiobolus ranarum TaxID=34480 RepID=A0ABR2WDF6_9FUNG